MRSLYQIALKLSVQLRKIGLRGEDYFAWHPHDTFIGATASSLGQPIGTGTSDVDANDGYIAAIEFPEVWATV